MGETINAACRQDSQSFCCPRSAELLTRYEFYSLEKWLYSAEAHSLPLRGVEVAEQRRGRELLRLLLQAHVESRSDGNVGAAIRVCEQDSPDGHLIYTHKREHTRHLITIFGEIHVKRSGYGMEGGRRRYTRLITSLHHSLLPYLPKSIGNTTWSITTLTVRL